MGRKKEKYILVGVITVLAVMLIALGIDIEMKLYRLSQSEPVAVYTTQTESVFESTTVYSSESQLNEQSETSAASTTPVISETTTWESLIQDFSTTESISALPEDTTESAAASSTEFEITSTTIQTVDADQSFYVTQSGKKYHKGDCSYLSKSKIQVTTDEIIEGGYEPCSRCMKE